MSRDAQLREDLQRLVHTPGHAQALPELEPRGSLPAQRGRADYRGGPATGGGIASPLTEVPNTRQYDAPNPIKSTCGLYYLELRPTRGLTMTDANGATVKIELDRGTLAFEPSYYRT